MSEEISKNQEEINRQLDEARQRLNELKGTEADTVEELKQLTNEQVKYSALSEISDQLDKLEKSGGADLFWGDNYDQAMAAKQHQAIKRSIAEYDSRLAELQIKQKTREETIESLTAKINILNDDSIELKLHEEEVAEEYLIERERSPASIPCA